MNLCNLVKKFVEILKEKGIGESIKCTFVFLNIKVKGVLESKKESQKTLTALSEINYSKYDRIIVWNSTFGWDVTLFQRPQHIARALSRQKSLVFYCVTPYTDSDVKSIKQIEDNLYLINMMNKTSFELVYEKLISIDIPKYMQIYSTEMMLTVADLDKYRADGFNILYEYIDDINPAISVKDEIPPNIITKYNYVMNDATIPVVVTADDLQNDVISKRGESNLTYSSNGVDYSFFADYPEDSVALKEEYRKIVESGKIIIGYYGALATWFDYDLVKYIATERKDVHIVLIGAIYDDSSKKQEALKLDNVTYLGPIPYKELPAYAKKFDICTIPFKVNDITNATSPLKLFEYMALAKPIITTGMYECRKYESVLIAENYGDYLDKIDCALKLILENDAAYYELLRREALENTWEAKAKSISILLDKIECK